MILLLVVIGSASLVLFASGLPGFAPRVTHRRIDPYLPKSWDGSSSFRAQRGGLFERAIGALFLEDERVTANRLAAAGSERAVLGFRVERTLIGVSSSIALAAMLTTMGGRVSGATVLAAILGGASASGARDRWLSTQAERRSKRMAAKLPLALDLLAIAVRSGESVEASIKRVSHCLAGTELGVELDRVVAEIRSGIPTSEALQNFAKNNPDHRLQRAGRALSLAIENGTPVAGVLNGQASDVRDAERRGLLEAGGKREVWMLVPVVFLLLPVMVLLVFYTSLVSLDMFFP